MTNESGEVYTVQSFDEVYPLGGWTVDHETTNPLDAVLAARHVAWVGFDVRIIREGRTVWAHFQDAGRKHLIDAPAWIENAYPEWLVLTDNHDKPAMHSLTMSMPTMAGEVWAGGFSLEVKDAGHHLENMWKS